MANPGFVITPEMIGNVGELVGHNIDPAIATMTADSLNKLCNLHLGEYLTTRVKRITPELITGIYVLLGYSANPEKSKLIVNGLNLLCDMYMLCNGREKKDNKDIKDNIVNGNVDKLPVTIPTAVVHEIPRRRPRANAAVATIVEPKVEDVKVENAKLPRTITLEEFNSINEDIRHIFSLVVVANLSPNICCIHMEETVKKLDLKMSSAIFTVLAASDLFKWEQLPWLQSEGAVNALNAIIEDKFNICNQNAIMVLAGKVIVDGKVVHNVTMQELKTSRF